MYNFITASSNLNSNSFMYTVQLNFTCWSMLKDVKGCWRMGCMEALKAEYGTNPGHSGSAMYVHHPLLQSGILLLHLRFIHVGLRQIQMLNSHFRFANFNCKSQKWQYKFIGNMDTGVTIFFHGKYLRFFPWRRRNVIFCLDRANKMLISQT